MLPVSPQMCNCHGPARLIAAGAYRDLFPMLFNSYRVYFRFSAGDTCRFLCNRHRFADVGATLDYLCFTCFLCFMAAAERSAHCAVNIDKLRVGADPSAIERRRKAISGPRLVLLLGIAFNVAFLGYFKYIDFGRGAVNDIFGTNLVLTHVILPLGISFITFQKIAFLIDVHAGRVKSFTLQDYCLFVLFFPQLIAGPIVHYREMMPQFHSASCRFDKENFAVGLTLLSFGLFKKVVLADHIATFVTPIYGQAASGGGISLLLAWAAAIGFTLQIYFDFSGYTDMALGLARFFGIRLPQNFNSPLQASSIIDFWLRWHMTLTRFLTAYIYNPLTLSLTRRRMAKAIRLWRPKHNDGRICLSADVSPAADDVCFGTLARRRLWFYRLGFASRSLSHN